jgi:hypothetical protein
VWIRPDRLRYLQTVAAKAAAAAALSILLFTAASCTQRAADATKQRVDTALDATKSGANKAIDATKAAGDKTRDAAQNAATTTTSLVTDPVITGKLKAKFADEKVLQGSHIDVDTSRGVVTLKGTVLSVTAKTRAETIAAGTEGVASVVNLLVVQ